MLEYVHFPFLFLFPYSSNADTNLISIVHVSTEIHLNHPIINRQFLREYGYGALLLHSESDPGNNIVCMIGNNEQLVYCEGIDLRENSKKWNVLWEKTSMDTFSMENIQSGSGFFV